MKLLSTMLILTAVACNSASAAELKELGKPSGRKVNSAFRYWEKINTPNLCYPNGSVYHVSEWTRFDTWESVLTEAIKLQGKDNKNVTLKSLTSESQVRATAKSAIEKLGMVPSKKFSDKLVRVFEKQDARRIYTAETDNGDQLNGRVIAIVDYEKEEITLLTDGETFEVRDCDG